ncbi:hypothetical protein DSECCO2_105230 [anaerobic digester metagenome]
MHFVAGRSAHLWSLPNSQENSYIPRSIRPIQERGGLSLCADLLERREEILGVAAGHGARRVRVFGSVARDEETPESDLDLLVEFEPGRSLLDHIALAQD